MTVIMADHVFGGPEEQSRHIDEMHERCLAQGAVDWNRTAVLGGMAQGLAQGLGAALGWCPMAWDGLVCWNATPAGSTAAQPCPEYIAGFDTQENATRRCLADGTWFVNLTMNRTWTNYTMCHHGVATVVVSLPDSANSSLVASALPVVKSMSQVGYSVSLVSLLAASAVLATIKKLRCPRNMLHLHLFASFILRAFLLLLKSGLFVDGIGLPSDLLEKDGGNVFVDRYENWVCKLITSLWQYFIMANYSWILMEGLYLHNLIFLALFSDTSSIKLYVALGWGLPSIFVLAWVIVRIYVENDLCWTTNNSPVIFLLVRVPITVSIVVNFFLFLNIIRMLMKKLQASICDETRRHRRWAKSTLVLMPLFGAHYFIFLGMSYGVHTGVKSREDELVEVVWLFLDQAFASFQGFFVAVLFCFMNGEVRAELDKAWSSRPPLWGARRGGFWFKSRPTRHPSLHSYDTCSSYGNHQAPWAIRKRSEGRSTVTSTTALPSEMCASLCASSIVSPRPEEVPLSVTTVNEGAVSCSRL
ncbi:secretin receptor-like isoform X2 [Frankliniella occidentalis]|uniref:Secretin receptor-like isoform X2 n=1 Tax=Frankliniella occidentalis TaxID=133901 RepID=A0A9C6UA75_FRAOC|nr:secretin receptor-like isoform X2 [Frankliniella occidentalis]